MLLIFLEFQLIVTLLCVGGQQCQYEDVELGCIDDNPVRESLGHDVGAIDNSLYPYMVSFQERLENKECYRHFCGGTMIAPNLVLTAAHCMDDIKQNQPISSSQGYLIYKLKSNKYFVAISPKCRHLASETYQRFSIEEIYIHPDYTKKLGALHNDVALAKLIVTKENFYKGPLVQLVNQKTQLSTIQQPLKTMGYGKEKGQSDNQYTVFPLHGGDLSYLDYDMCKLLLIDRGDNISAYELDYDTMVCCFNPWVGTCDGDSGGPLLNGDVQIGIVSWGANGSCQVLNTAQAPSVFVRLPKYVAWIQSIIGKQGCYEFELCLKEKLLLSPPPVTPIFNEDPCDEAQNLQCDVEGLQSFKSSVTEGKDQLSTWIGDNPCGWQYVTCSKVDGVSQRVVELDLNLIDFDFSKLEDYYNDNYFDSNESLFAFIYSKTRILSGILVPEFSKIRYMRIFKIEGLNVNGSIPKEYSLLNRVQVFSLQQTGLTNTIPSEYSVWSQIKNFTIVQSLLTGTLPQQFSTWKQLSEFNVASSKITGSIPPEYSEWIDLTHLLISNNKLWGTIPAELSTWKNCSIISFDRNILSGTLPSDFSEMTQVSYMSFSVNKLKSTLPQEYSKLVDLVFFSIGNSSILGTIPAQFSTWKKAQFVQMFENTLTGSIPLELSEMSSMQQLSLSSNKLTGTLPVQFSKWWSIQSIRFNDNFITGTLPVQYSQFVEILDFQVQKNKLTGTLPVQYSNWFNIDTFVVNFNQLRGILPVQYSEMIHLDRFIVNSNYFLSGTLPKTYSAMTQIQVWASQRTQIFQDIPEEWSVFGSTTKIFV